MIGFVDIPRPFTIRESSHRIHNPLTSEKLATLGQLAAQLAHEIGTPLCVTVDFESLDDDAVTIRDRDTTDVIVGVCFGNDRAYANDLRVESARVIARFLEGMRGADDRWLSHGEEELKARGRKLFGGAAHDRLGEMASTIPARISIANRLRYVSFTQRYDDGFSPPP